MKINFNQWECEILIRKYPLNNRKAIQLVDAEDGSPVATATVNFPDEPLNDDEVLIKNYSENEGVYQALVDGKIISEAIEYIQRGFVTLPKCKLLI